MALRAPGTLLPPGSPLSASLWPSPGPYPERGKGMGEGTGGCDGSPPHGRGSHPWGPGVLAAAAAPSAPTSPGPGPYLTVPPGSLPDRASRAGDQVGQREHGRLAPSPSKLHGGAQPWAPRDQAGAPDAGRPAHPGALGLECSGHHVLQEVRRARVGGAEASLCLGPCSLSTLRRG